MKEKKANGSRKSFWSIVRPKSGLGLAVRIVLCLLIPEAYVMLCGLIVDAWLHAYSLTTFVFVSYVVIALLCLAVLVASIVNFVRRGKAGKEPVGKAGKEAEASREPAEEISEEPEIDDILKDIREN